MGDRDRIPAREPLRVVLELVPGREPIEGSLQGPGEPRAFTGWMELVAALEWALERAVLSPDGGSPDLNAKEE